MALHPEPQHQSAESLRLPGRCHHFEKESLQIESARGAGCIATLMAVTHLTTDEKHNRPQILVVEDDEPMAILLRYNLEAAGCLVETIRSGIAAIDRLALNAPDLVLLDWMLPGLSGPEVLRQLRERPRTAGIPVIMLTARNSAEDRRRAVSLGVNAYLVKPFALSDLLGCIGHLLGRRVSTA